LKAIEKWGSGRKEVSRVMERVELAKVKYIHSRYTLKYPFEYQLRNYQ
jgi:predicted HTH transcriptional regulator